MKRYWLLRGLKMFALAALAVALLGYVVMGVWNAVLPAVTGLHAISFMQALGLLVLSRILFGGLRGWRRRGGNWRERIHARWEQMTPEEREKFRDVMVSRHRCRRSDTSAPASPS